MLLQGKICKRGLNRPQDHVMEILRWNENLSFLGAGVLIFHQHWVLSATLVSLQI